MINHAIGAVGVASKECKTVIGQYGKTMLNSLLSQVDVITHTTLIYKQHNL